MKQCKICKSDIVDNRIYCSNECKYSDSDLNSKRVRKEKNDKNKKIKCKLCGWETKDILNLGGHPKKHLYNKHDIETGTYLDYFNEIKIEKKKVWQCPECEWNTVDLKNKSGCITNHILTHYKKVSDFIEKYVQYKVLFTKQLNTLNRLDDIAKDGNNIKCEICGKLFYKLTQTHLKKHNITPSEYKNIYGINITSSPKTIKKQVNKSNDPEIKQRMINSLIKTNNEKYGTNSYTQTEEGKNIVRQKTLKNTYDKYIKSKELSEYVEILFTVGEYNGNINSEYKFRCKMCENEFTGKLENGRIPRCFSCYPKINKGYSNSERDLSDYIKSELNIKIDTNIRLFNNLEFDIFCKEYNIAFEFDGIYWHSELNGKNKDYHLNKTKLCEQNGIKLIHIFEDEWIYNKEIVKNRLKNLFNLIDTKIYARQCSIKLVTNSDKTEFLTENHLQGDDNSSIKLGLYYNNYLVSLMTFSKSRYNKNIEWELTRFVNKININIIGGFSKLLKYFIKNYSVSSIMTFADRRWSNRDNVYEKVGFKYSGETVPSYWYFNKSQNRQHRFNFRKSILKNKLKNFDETLTEWQNMQLNGYDRIWDCGSYKYEMILDK